MTLSREESHYELLDVPTDASPLEIRRAYQDMFELYQGDSLISYSLFTESERKDLLSRLENAYYTLVNEDRRSAYDRGLIDQGVMVEENRYRNTMKIPIPLYDPMNRSTGASQPLPSQQNAAADAAASPVVQDILKKETLTGQDLRNIRGVLNVSLERIAQESKIKLGILQAIEEEAEDLLPPLPYLKGFIKLYARCLMLDGERVAEAYMQHRKKLLP